MPFGCHLDAIWMPFGCHLDALQHCLSLSFEKSFDKHCQRMFKWHKIHIKWQKFVIFAIWIFFAMIEEMASASLVLFMLIRTL